MDGCGQYKTIYDTHGPCQLIQSIMKAVFHQFRQIHHTCESLRYVDVYNQAIFVTTKFTPSLAHVRRVLTVTHLSETDKRYDQEGMCIYKIFDYRIIMENAHVVTGLSPKPQCGHT